MINSKPIFLRQYIIGKSIRNFLLSGVNIVIALALLPIITKAVGQAGYGILAILTTLSAQVNLVEFGFGAYITKMVSEWTDKTSESEINTFLSTSAYYMGILTIMSALVISLILFFFFDTLFKIPIDLTNNLIIAKFLTISIFIVTFISMFYSRILAGCHAFEYLRITNIVSEILRFFWILIVLGPQSNIIYNLNWILFIRLILTLLLISFLIWGTIRFLPKPYKITPFYIDKSKNKSVTNFSAPLIIGKLLSRTQSLGTVFVTGMVLGPIGSGLVLLGQRIFQTASDFSANFILTIFPIASKINKDSKEKIPLLYLNGTHYNLLLNCMLASFLAITIHPLLQSLFSLQFHTVDKIVWAFLPTLIFGSMYSLGNEMLVGIAKHMYLTKYLVLLAIVSLISQFAGAKFLGPVGVAAGVSIASFTYMIFSLSVHKKYLGLKLSVFFTHVFKNLLIAGIILILGFFLLPLQKSSNIYFIIFYTSIILVLSGTSAFFIAVLPNERLLVVSQIKKKLLFEKNKGDT